MSTDKDKFYVVLLPEGGEPEVRSFATLEGLAAFLKDQPPRTKGFLFYGRRLDVTSGAFRYLLYDGQKVPLFDPPEPGEVDESGGLGAPVAEDGVDPSYKNLVLKALSGPGVVKAQPVEVDDEDEDLPS